MTGLWFVVLGDWFVVLGDWFVILGDWFVILGDWFVVLWFPSPGGWLGDDLLCLLFRFENIF